VGVRVFPVLVPFTFVIPLVFEDVVVVVEVFFKYLIVPVFILGQEEHSAVIAFRRIHRLLSISTKGFLLHLGRPKQRPPFRK